jgi:hypothetical protein
MIFANDPNFKAELEVSGDYQQFYLTIVFTK